MSNSRNYNFDFFFVKKIVKSKDTVSALLKKQNTDFHEFFLLSSSIFWDPIQNLLGWDSQYMVDQYFEV